MTLKMGWSPLVPAQVRSCTYSPAGFSCGVREHTGPRRPGFWFQLCCSPGDRGPVIRRPWIPVFSTSSFPSGGLSTRALILLPFEVLPFLGQGSSGSHLLSGWWTRWCPFSSSFELFQAGKGKQGGWLLLTYVGRFPAGWGMRGTCMSHLTTI